MNAEETLARYASQIEEALVEALPSDPDTPPDLLEAMRYSLMAGGKRLRPILVLLAAEACGADPRDAMPAACAVEMVHTYSLIHDDLPAMDDDDLRRGQPTSHVAFGEAMAILAGDALLTRAFEILAADLPDPVVAAECCRVLASAGGSDGMVGGQVADLAATNTSPESVDDPLQVLGDIHRRKTGRLLAASLELGAVVAGANIQVRESLLDYGQQVGLAFQVADDLLDVEGDINRTGKTSGRDAHLGKWTYPALAGNDTSRRLARNCIASACAAVEPLGEAGEPLKVLAEFVIERDH
ncbi:MAG TPA: farnesyl-diphosphate synthase [Planctomycetaceae bacterium]|nr:farnesyl-diphosphate synthase [Planctomycetaceae bacterium]|tara:strand:- start:86 stop:979 length:894 start_codon:yes stop_codon:yes gene_type:complete